MQHDGPANADRIFHPQDPRQLARDAIQDGALELAAVYAQLSNAEAIHRLAKTLGRVADVEDHGPVPIERGRHRRAADQPAESEQAA